MMPEEEKKVTQMTKAMTDHLVNHFYVDRELLAQTKKD